MSVAEVLTVALLAAVLEWMLVFGITRGNMIEAYRVQHCAPFCRDGEPSAHYKDEKFSCACTVVRSVP